jgi:hypothetical protein
MTSQTGSRSAVTYFCTTFESSHHTSLSPQSFYQTRFCEQNNVVQTQSTTQSFIHSRIHTHTCTQSHPPTHTPLITQTQTRRAHVRTHSHTLCVSVYVCVCVCVCVCWWCVTLTANRPSRVVGQPVTHASTWLPQAPSQGSQGLSSSPKWAFRG